MDEHGHWKPIEIPTEDSRVKHAAYMQDWRKDHPSANIEYTKEQWEYVILPRAKAAGMAPTTFIRMASLSSTGLPVLSLDLSKKLEEAKKDLLGIHNILSHLDIMSAEKRMEVNTRFNKLAAFLSDPL